MEIVSTLYDVEDLSVRTIHSLPSWCPDWSAPAIPLPWRTHGGGIYSTGGNEAGFAYHHLPTSDPRIVAVEGFSEDVVLHVGGRHEETINGDGLMTSLRLLKSIYPTCISALGAGEGDIIDAFWRTLIANLPGSEQVAPPSETYGPSFRSTVRFIIAKWLSQLDRASPEFADTEGVINDIAACGRPVHIPKWSEVVELERAIRTHNELSAEISSQILDAVHSTMPYAISLQRMFRCRRFFITKKGRMGIGPQSLRKGDQIYIFKSWMYPFLLRDVSLRTRQFVGCAYVRGIMFGEALDGAQFERVEIH